MSIGEFSLSNPPKSDPFMILRYRDRQYAAELIAVAILNYDLFTWIRDHAGADTAAICSQFQLAQRPVDVLITLCRANGFVTLDEQARLKLTQLGIEHLTSDSAWFLGPYYKPIQDTPIYRNFIQVLQTGKPANWQAQKEGADWHASMREPNFARDFTNLMNCRGLAFGQLLAQRLENKIGHRTHLLDIAGGSGIYSATMVSTIPHLSATILEQSPVDEIARAEIAGHGLEARVNVISADMFVDPWPKNADIHLFSNVLHDWDVDEALQLLQRSCDNLPAGGLLVIHDAFINEEKSGPLPVAEYSALLMNITQGKCYSVGEYREMLVRVGFIPGTFEPTIGDRGFMTATRA
jgi:hypothetical protein